MRRVARSPSYDVNAAAPIADNDIDLKIYGGKKFNAATDCDDFTAVSTFGESRGSRRERGRARIAGGHFAMVRPMGIVFTEKSLNLRYEKKKLRSPKGCE